MVFSIKDQNNPFNQLYKSSLSDLQNAGYNHGQMGQDFWNSQPVQDIVGKYQTGIKGLNQQASAESGNARSPFYGYDKSAFPSYMTMLPQSDAAAHGGGLMGELGPIMNNPVPKIFSALSGIGSLAGLAGVGLGSLGDVGGLFQAAGAPGAAISNALPSLSQTGNYLGNAVGAGNIGSSIANSIPSFSQVGNKVSNALGAGDISSSAESGFGNLADNVRSWSGNPASGGMTSIPDMLPNTSGSGYSPSNWNGAASLGSNIGDFLNQSSSMPGTLPSLGGMSQMPSSLPSLSMGEQPGGLSNIPSTGMTSGPSSNPPLNAGESLAGAGSGLAGGMTEAPSSLPSLSAGEALGGASAAGGLGGLLDSMGSGLSSAKNALSGVMGSSSIAPLLGVLVGSQLGQQPQQSYQSNIPDFTTPQFQPTQQPEMQMPKGLEFLMNLSPIQQATSLATSGVYGGGNGPDEQKYFMNLENRKLVNQDNSTNSLDTLSPIERSYLQRLGFGSFMGGDSSGASASGVPTNNNLLEAMTRWSPM